MTERVFHCQQLSCVKVLLAFILNGAAQILYTSCSFKRNFCCLIMYGTTAEIFALSGRRPINFSANTIDYLSC